MVWNPITALKSTVKKAYQTYVPTRTSTATGTTSVYVPKSSTDSGGYTSTGTPSYSGGGGYPSPEIQKVASRTGSTAKISRELTASRTPERISVRELRSKTLQDISKRKQLVVPEKKPFSERLKEASKQRTYSEATSKLDLRVKEKLPESFKKIIKKVEDRRAREESIKIFGTPAEKQAVASLEEARSITGFLLLGAGATPKGILKSPNLFLKEPTPEFRVETIRVKRTLTPEEVSFSIQPSKDILSKPIVQSRLGLNELKSKEFFFKTGKQLEPAIVQPKFQKFKQKRIPELPQKPLSPFRDQPKSVTQIEARELRSQFIRKPDRIRKNPLSKTFGKPRDIPEINLLALRKFGQKVTKPKPSKPAIIRVIKEAEGKPIEIKSATGQIQLLKPLKQKQKVIEFKLISPEKLKQKPKQISQFELFPEEEFVLISRFVGKEISKSKIKPLGIFGTQSKESQRFKQLERDIVKEIPKQPSLIKIRTSQVESSAQKQSQRLKEAQKQIFKQPLVSGILKQKTKTAARTKTIERVRERIIRERIIRERIIIKKKEKTVFKSKNIKITKSGNKFKVYIKRFGEDVLVGEFGTLEEAKNQLESLLLTTLGRSGLVKQKGKAIKVDLGFKFRPAKKEPTRVVQKRKFSLGTKSEVGEIQMFKKKSKKRNPLGVF